MQNTEATQAMPIHHPSINTLHFSLSRCSSSRSSTDVHFSIGCPSSWSIMVDIVIGESKAKSIISSSISSVVEYSLPCNVVVEWSRLHNLPQPRQGCTNNIKFNRDEPLEISTKYPFVYPELVGRQSKLELNQQVNKSPNVLRSLMNSFEVLVRFRLPCLQRYNVHTLFNGFDVIFISKYGL